MTQVANDIYARSEGNEEPPGLFPAEYDLLLWHPSLPWFAKHSWIVQFHFYDWQHPDVQDVQRPPGSKIGALIKSGKSRVSAAVPYRAEMHNPLTTGAVRKGGPRPPTSCPLAAGNPGSAVHSELGGSQRFPNQHAYRPHRRADSHTALGAAHCSVYVTHGLARHHPIHTHTLHRTHHNHHALRRIHVHRGSPKRHAVRAAPPAVSHARVHPVLRRAARPHRGGVNARIRPVAICRDQHLFPRPKLRTSFLNFRMNRRPVMVTSRRNDMLRDVMMDEETYTK
ncbi:hypothetical protein B0H14DRAFT_3158607 [Mycena olivaceomarginata]|nr:hypothetical protein B0H14DRAFT_3158607 [Mycena olivaceomarginata]